MENSEDLDRIAPHSVVDPIWEVIQQNPPRIAVVHGTTLWISRDSLKCLIHGTKKLGDYTFVALRSIKCSGLGHVQASPRFDPDG